MIRLGIVIAPQFLPQMQQVQHLMQSNCELTILSYTQFTELVDMYEKYSMQVDGFIITEAGYEYLRSHIGTFPIPTYNYQITQTDLYKCLFQICVEHKQLDFSRVLIDFIWEQNEFLGLKQVLKPDDLPYMLPSIPLNEHIYEEVFNFHLKLWRQGLIDLSITRVANIVPMLIEHGIPYIYLAPSPQSIIQQIEQVLIEIESLKLADNQIAIGQASIHGLDATTSDPNDIELKVMLLHKALLEYSINDKISFIIQKTNTNFEIISSSKDLNLITNNLTECRLMAFLSSNLPFQVNLGFGTGATMHKARMNAQLANQQSADSSVRGTFIVLMNGQVLGPLGEKNSLEYWNEITPRIQQLSESLNITPLQIQKIMGVLTKLNSNELSSEELAYHLGVTIRSANRIVKQLESKGVATVSYKKQEKLRGRPKVVYKIDFNL